MTYVYLLQPAEYLNTNCYKIGISSVCDLSRLKSYGAGTEYIRQFQCINYREAETELIKELHSKNKIVLFKGREYFCGQKSDILEVFTEVMNKYTQLEIEEMKNIEGAQNFNDNASEQYQTEETDQESETKLTNESNLEENKKSDTSIKPKIEATKQVCTKSYLFF